MVQLEEMLFWTSEVHIIVDDRKRNIIVDLFFPFARFFNRCLHQSQTIPIKCIFIEIQWRYSVKFCYFRDAKHFHGECEYCEPLYQTGGDNFSRTCNRAPLHPASCLKLRTIFNILWWLLFSSVAQLWLFLVTAIENSWVLLHRPCFRYSSWTRQKNCVNCWYMSDDTSSTKY